MFRAPALLSNVNAISNMKSSNISNSVDDYTNWDINISLVLCTLDVRLNECWKLSKEANSTTTFSSFVQQYAEVCSASSRKKILSTARTWKWSYSDSKPVRLASSAFQRSPTISSKLSQIIKYNHHWLISQSAYRALTELLRMFKSFFVLTGTCGWRI